MGVVLETTVSHKYQNKNLSCAGFGFWLVFMRFLCRGKTKRATALFTQQMALLHNTGALSDFFFCRSLTMYMLKVSYYSNSWFSPSPDALCQRLKVFVSCPLTDIKWFLNQIYKSDEPITEDVQWKLWCPKSHKLIYNSGEDTTNHVKLKSISNIDRFQNPFQIFLIILDIYVFILLID